MRTIMKRRLIAVFVISIMCVCGFAGCSNQFLNDGKEQSDLHKHKFERSQIVAATCQSDGYILHICACGDSYREPGEPRIAHEYGEWKTLQEPTVDNEGQREKHCIRCNDRIVETLEKLPEHEHTFEDTVVAPTCLEKGYTLHTCTVCGYKTPDSETDALGHSWSSWSVTKEATTTAAGEKSRSCTGCGKTESESIPKLDLPPQHTCSYEATVIAPTCTTAGYTQHTCSCGKSYKDNETVAIGHLYGSWTVTVQPTSSSTGTRQCVCSRCGHINSETVPKLDVETAEKYEHYIDPRIQITTNGSGVVSYRYNTVGVIDTRTWGDPPTILISDDDGFQVTYYNKSNKEICVTLSPVAGYVHRCAILEDGTYVFSLIGDYKD